MPRHVRLALSASLNCLLSQLAVDLLGQTAVVHPYDMPGSQKLCGQQECCYAGDITDISAKLQYLEFCLVS